MGGHDLFRSTHGAASSQLGMGDVFELRIQLDD